ncbi:MAG: transposase [Streptococcus gallolyticus]|nr:transposase [Streptococcus gallolyticus]
MLYSRRTLCETNIYHLMSRGSGKMIIFEDESDRLAFLSILKKALRDKEVSLLSWCLMDNHYHLLVRGEMPEVSKFMYQINKNYCFFFNKRHQREGHLFQNRFKSVAIEDEAQFMQTLRYIHLNPIDFCNFESYEWSSYSEYLNFASSRNLIDPEFALNLFDGITEFKKFHKIEAGESFKDNNFEFEKTSKNRISEEDKSEYLEILKMRGLNSVPLDNKIKRDELITSLKSRGFSVRQIALLTGIGRNVIQRA